MTCLDSIKKFIKNNVYTLFNTNDDYEYHLMNNIKNDNDLNIHLMYENNNYINEIFDIDDENMIKSIIKENDELIKSCEAEINNTEDSTNNNEILITDKEVNDFLNNNIKKK